MVARAANLPDPPANYAPPFLPGQFSLLEHYLNARKAAYAGLLDGLQGVGPAYDFTAPSTRAECALLLHDLLGKLTPPTTTTTATSTTTTTTATTTTTSSTTTTTSSTTTSTSSTTTSSSTTTTGSTTTTTLDPGYESLGGVLTSAPAVCSWGPGRLDVFVRGGDGALYHKYFDGGWSDWENLGGVIAAGSGPAAVSWGPGRIDVFIRGTDNKCYRKYFNAVGGWSAGWDDLGGGLYSSPAASSRGPNRLDVFVRGELLPGGQGELYHKWWDGSSWHDWEYLGGWIAGGSSPAAVSWGPNRIDVFYADGKDDSLAHQWWDGSTWSFDDLGGTVTAGPGVSSWGPGRLDIFVRATNGVLYERIWNNGWLDWQAVGGVPIASGPAAVSWGPDRIDVFVQGTDDALWHKYWDGASWQP